MIPATLRAQLPDQSTAAYRIEGETVIEWFGHAGRTYFIQISDDADPLRTWIWAPLIEAGNDEPISYEFGGEGPRGFARLQYVDAVPPPGVSLEDWDIDGDGLSNWQEITGNGGQDASNPLLVDTDGDGTPDGEDPSPDNGTVGGTPIRGTFESRWIDLNVFDLAFYNGQSLTMAKVAVGDDSTGGDWVAGRPEFAALPQAGSYQDVLGAASAFPLPPDESAEGELRGLMWRNISEQPHDWDLPSGIDPGVPYREWGAGRLEHRLRLNKGAPLQGYEHRLQVLKLDWTRGTAQGSPWVPAGGSSIIKTTTFAKGETLSDWIPYDPLPALAENSAVSLHAVRFEETEPESGFDDHVRYLAGQRFDLPWLVVADSITPETKPNAQVKFHFSPADPPLALTVEVPAGRTATVSPETVSGEGPMVLTIEGDLNPVACEGTLKVNGVAVLNLAFYPRKTVKLAVHEIALTNDDQEQVYSYVDQQTFQTHQKTVDIGEGRPDRVCITKGSGILQTQTPGGDDFISQAGDIRTGQNGICETTAAAGDIQVIPVNQGEPNAAIITPGANGELNTAPNAPNANLQGQNGGPVVNPQDDAVDGTTITTGPDGIRQTPAPSPRQEPVNVPSQTEFQQDLDRVYGKQANLWFEIQSWNEVDAAFDVASSLPGDANFPTLKKPNRYFDFFTIHENSDGKPRETREEQIVKAASHANGDDVVNLYFVAARLQRYAFSLDHPAGYARSPLRRLYVSAYRFGTAPADQTPAWRLLGTGAHEIGHLDVIGANDKPGLHHPWQPPKEEDDTSNIENGLIPYEPETNHTLLDQQSDTRRLMWYQEAVHPDPVTGRSPSTLLKHEVDRLHEILPP